MPDIKMRAQSRRSFLDFVTPRIPPAEAYWLHVNRTAMACRFEITLPVSEQKGVAAAVAALDEVDRIEDQLTVFRDASVLSYVNKHAAERPIAIEQSLFDLLRLCKEIHEETSGAFDITSTPLTRCWGFLSRQGQVPEVRVWERARELVGSDKVILTEEPLTVSFARAGVALNLGSIGKGYALERVSAQIRLEVSTALLNAGSSSFRAIGNGEPGGNGWSVGLRNPRSKRTRLGIVELRDCAMSTSGSEEQFFDHDGKRYGHIIDPRSGWPASGVSTVSVISQSATLSDALATAFYVGGPEVAQKYCDAHDHTLAIILESDSETPVLIGKNKNCDVKTLKSTSTNA